MKSRHSILVLLLVSLVLTFQSCSLIGDIFQAGMWVGIIIVVIIVLLIIFLISKLRRRG